MDSPSVWPLGTGFFTLPPSLETQGAAPIVTHSIRWQRASMVCSFPTAAAQVPCTHRDCSASYWLKVMLGAVKKKAPLMSCTGDSEHISSHFSGLSSQAAVTRSYGSFMFSVLRNRQCIFQSGCAMLHPTDRWHTSHPCHTWGATFLF